MDSATLRAKQAPLEEQYRSDASSAITCKLSTGTAMAVAKVAGLHPASGGDALSGELCSGDMLLEALVACAGVTLKAVAKCPRPKCP